MIKITLLPSVLVSLFLYLIACQAFANSDLPTNNYAQNKTKTILTVAIEEIGYPPYQYEDAGEIKGFTIDVLEYFEANSQYDFEYIILPWPRALNLVAKGNVDMILTLFKNKEREKIYNYIEPSYAFEVNQFFTLADKDINFSGDLKQLTPYLIGTRREFSYGNNFDKAYYLTKLPALTEEVILNLLLANRIDIAISNPFIFNEMILKRNVGTKVKAIKPYVELTPVYLGLTKKRADSQKINKTLNTLSKKLKKSAYYQTLLNKYQLNFTK